MTGGKGGVLVILGATASGKTAVGLAVARRLHGEIISADSRAFFRGLDLITDKPSPEERGAIPHHLVDCVPMDGTYDAMTFRRDVEKLLPAIRGRGHQPMIVGGGTLYLGAILRGIFEGAAKDPGLRARLSRTPLPKLYERLQQVDSDAACNIHPNDRLRIVRAIEVFETMGRPISQLQAGAVPLDESFLVIGLRRERAAHRAAIAQRLRQMLASGLLDEMRRLFDAGLAPTMQAYRTIGVPESRALLRGELTDAAFVETVAAQTWNLARRQMAWFRREENAVWLDVDSTDTETVVDDIVTRWNEWRGRSA